MLSALCFAIPLSEFHLFFRHGTDERIGFFN
jgi:hypothetical protein